MDIDVAATAKAVIHVRNNVLEEAALVADAQADICRKAVSECKNWSPAQAEWSRARDHCIFIAENIRALKGEE